MISPYIHRCVHQSGDAAGNKHWQDVDAVEVEYGYTCDVCGEPLATVEQIVAHIYGELLEQDQ